MYGMRAAAALWLIFSALLCIESVSALRRNGGVNSTNSFLALADRARLAGVKGFVPSGNSTSKVSHLSLNRRSGTRGEELEEWKDSGKAVTCSLSSNQLSTVVAAISPESFSAELHTIVDPFKSRFVTQPGNRQAADFLKQRLTQLGFVVKEQAFDANVARAQAAGGTSTGPTAGNIIAFKKGGDLAHELVIFGAHYDSVNWKDGALSPAPGVDDNGSGVAAVLQVAKAVADQPLRRSVAFIAFQAEEVGLVGSTRFVQDVLKGGGAAALGLELGKPVAVLIADEVAYPGRPQPAFSKKVIFETSGRSDDKNAMVDTLAYASKAEPGIAGYEVNYHGFGSDHMPFLDAGYPAVLLIERDNSYHADTWGHSSQDTFEHVDSGFGATLTRLAARTILTFAMPKAQ